jgi:26S proteasome regulatory subunit N4
MGFTPSPTSPAAEQVHTLVGRKDAIEAELEVHLAVLKDNAVTMRSPLVDSEGFPRADIDVYAVRGARVRIIELRNDLKAVMDSIAKALQDVYDPTAAGPSTLPVPVPAPEAAAGPTQETSSPAPFAKVDGVAPGSPAAEAVRPYHTFRQRSCRSWLKQNHCRVYKGTILLSNSDT